ncbi:hypothetical protein GGI24_005749 [Coemansia furcata]|nr:hypothetical protein GGI24_005749 [Coemansia furcata]
MSQNSQSIPAPSSGDKKGTPIPISMPSGMRSGAYTGSEAGTSRHLESGSQFPPGSADFARSHLDRQGIEAPPNSLVTPSAHLEQGSLGGSRFAGGGWNAPPNTPAQANKLQQMMASAGAGSGSVQGYSTSNVPSNSFIVGKIGKTCMENVREADEDEQTDQDMEVEAEFSPDSSNQSSFRQGTRRILGDESEEDMFTMDD